MSVILTATVYVWCDSLNCIGVLDSRFGFGTTLGGPAAAAIVLAESISDRT